MSGPDIFISYCRQDRPSARLFAEAFAEEGFSVWWDAALRSGETFDEVIEKELRAAKAVVVLWSPRSVASRWVRAEATLADRFNKLAPVIIEACDLPIIFELTHAANLADWTGNEADPRWTTLIDDIRRLVGEREPQPATVRPTPIAKPALQAEEAHRSAIDDHAAAKSESASRDELIRALERLSESRSTELSKPTPVEEERTEFFKRSDQHRLQEGETVHCLQRLDGEEEVARFIVTPAGPLLDHQSWRCDDSRAWSHDPASQWPHTMNQARSRSA